MGEPANKKEPAPIQEQAPLISLSPCPLVSLSPCPPVPPSPDYFSFSRSRCAASMSCWAW